YQKSSLSHELQYRNDQFYLIPKIKYSQSEYVTHKGWLDDPSSPINQDMDSGFNVPFIHDGKGTKLMERFFEFEHTTGINAIKGFDFEHNLFFSYNENQFNDYKEISQNHPFKRSKSGESEVRQQFRFPFNFSSTSAENLRNITISYERLSRLYETGVPFENETESYFNEKYGISRTIMGCSDTSLNLLKYPPWYFFTGRGNFGNGRDHVYDKLNSPLPTGDDPLYDYTNNLYVQDTYDVSSFFSFTGTGASLFSQLTQISERSGIEQLPQQMVQLSNGINLTFDLMQFFSSGFFRPNTGQNARHSAQFFCGYSYSRNMFITSNRLENIHSPSAGIQLGRNRKSISVNTSVDMIFREKEEYISAGTDRDKKDDKYFDNLPEEELKQADKTYTYSCEIKTDIPFLYNLLSRVYKLYDYPMFTIRYDQTLNRYDYKYTVSPEPYDLYMLTQTLELDVHKNIRGGLTGRYALEKYRDRESGNVTDEILSYEYILGLTVLF
ncbi:MAG TPA: hypothetical protein P5123_08960, partial [Spirochaetota bacterium]|nr:hypothetical protein [Spirochaetota bacterium]